MTRLIPEKTVELWNAFALRDVLGPSTWIWSPPRGTDQAASVVDVSRLRKVIFLELKAPSQPDHSTTDSVLFQIDTAQLTRYVRHYLNRRISDVLYVLPCTPWKHPPAVVLPAEAAPEMRLSFAQWAFVARASHIYRLLRSVRLNAGHMHLPRTASVRLTRRLMPMTYSVERIAHAWREPVPGPWRHIWYLTKWTELCYRTNPALATRSNQRCIRCISLWDVLHYLALCIEIRSTSLRSGQLVRPEPQRRHDPFVDLCFRRIEDEGARVLVDGLPSEAEWPTDIELTLTDRTLRIASRALVTYDGEQLDGDDDRDNRPRVDTQDDDAPTRRSLFAVGVQ